jgi:hypothetical protein
VINEKFGAEPVIEQPAVPTAVTAYEINPPPVPPVVVNASIELNGFEVEDEIISGAWADLTIVTVNPALVTALKFAFPAIVAVIEQEVPTIPVVVRAVPVIEQLAVLPAESTAYVTAPAVEPPVEAKVYVFAKPLVDAELIESAA